ncbi:hypothetical protein COU60_02575 [Candidatus Pacearchaeota archaeon CG10_big_fil_rev_8_21_14_0_10_34_76]|nr:MAG: hypothetical protein COU60_02575 [Candidatus Pacearchaeota archaeon CG10_big_fil_rev_8_21_14_0_10_34_76]
MLDPPPFYRGHEGFQELISNKDLARPGRAIRVYNYSRDSGDEGLYVLGTENQLFDSEGNIVKPEDVLSRESAPDGWSVEGPALHLLPESELEKILKQ